MGSLSHIHSSLSHALKRCRGGPAAATPKQAVPCVDGGECRGTLPKGAGQQFKKAAAEGAQVSENRCCGVGLGRRGTPSTIPAR